MPGGLSVSNQSIVSFCYKRSEVSCDGLYFDGGSRGTNIDPKSEEGKNVNVLKESHGKTNR